MSLPRSLLAGWVGEARYPTYASRKLCVAEVAAEPHTSSQGIAACKMPLLSLEEEEMQVSGRCWLAGWLHNIVCSQVAAAPAPFGLSIAAEREKGRAYYIIESEACVCAAYALCKN